MWRTRTWTIQQGFEYRYREHMATIIIVIEYRKGKLITNAIQFPSFTHLSIKKEGFNNQQMFTIISASYRRPPNTKWAATKGDFLISNSN